MNSEKRFDDFMRLGTVKRQNPDKSRAKFLLLEAEQNYRYLLELVKKMGVENLNANDYVKKCYDILTELIRAKMLIQGLSASGLEAHKAEITYMNVLNFDDRDIEFLNKMRYFRNGMLYYGTILDKEYAEKVIEFTKKNYPKLKSVADNHN